MVKSRVIVAALLSVSLLPFAALAQTGTASPATPAAPQTKVEAPAAPQTKVEAPAKADPAPTHKAEKAEAGKKVEKTETKTAEHK